MDKTGLGGCKENSNYLTVLCHCQVHRLVEGDYGVSLFFGKPLGIEAETESCLLKCHSGLSNVPLKQWSKIPTNTFFNLVDSLIRRVEAVIVAKYG